MTSAPAIPEEALRPLLEIPSSTYRLQFHAGYTLKDASALVDYLDRLGIGACYASPLLKARKGSTHGYDICDHKAINPEIGEETELERFAAALRERGMGLVLDFVPNHMGIDQEENPWWRDVLENGPSSPYARYFDIEWDPIKPELKHKVLLPILGDLYGAVLERGELRLAYARGALELHYGNQRLPINPRQAPRVLRLALPELEKAAEAPRQEFESILTQLENLPPFWETAPEKIRQRQREKEVARERLARLTERHPAVHGAIETAVQRVNGAAGDPASFDRLHAVLETQAYRLAYWKTSLHEINYRRFFDINHLAGLRVEDPDVFADSHAKILDWIGRGWVSGVRLDHPDGLYDPEHYFETLQDAALWARLRHRAAIQPAEETSWREALREWRLAARKADPADWAARPLYVLVEKILSVGEELQPHWAVHGTTGYDFLNEVLGVLCDPAGEGPLHAAYERFVAPGRDYARDAYICKKLIVSTSLASERQVLAHALNRISEMNRRHRDYTLTNLSEALREVVACFPIYRTYVTPSRLGAFDRERIEEAVSRARGMNPAMEPSIFDFVRESLAPLAVSGLSAAEAAARLTFAMKFQQYTAPVQAKGVEDTAFYRFNRLIACNEVGGHPGAIGLSVEALHNANRRRRHQWPDAMTATATHDTKRGEDARARLAALTELTEEWSSAVGAWKTLNARHRRVLHARLTAPDANDEYLFYQALSGVWPLENGPDRDTLPERLKAFMQKAVREAKRHSSWINPQAAYEEGVAGFVEGVLGDAAFLDHFIPWAEGLARLGAVNALAQLVLKIASPGMPDFYQGTELWDFSLVDPDNRRPVDFNRRRRVLDAFQDPLSRVFAAQKAETTTETDALLETWKDGRVKLWVTAAGLHLRRQAAGLFRQGDYRPLETAGERAGHLIAFAREWKGQTVIAAVPRLTAPLGGAERWPLGAEAWKDTLIALPSDMDARSFRNVFTGQDVQPQNGPRARHLAAADLFRRFPVALLCELQGVSWHFA